MDSREDLILIGQSFIDAEVHYEDISNFTISQGDSFIKLDKKQSLELAHFMIRKHREILINDLI